MRDPTVLDHDADGGGLTTELESGAETQIASFRAGVPRKDPIYGLLFMLSQFHLGVQITPVTGAEKLVADSHATAVAIETAGFDHIVLCVADVPRAIDF